MQQRSWVLKVACGGMQHHPACVHEVIEPLAITPHLQHIGMMGSVVLENHFAVWPGEVHPSNETSLHPNHELWDWRGQASPMDGQPNLTLGRRFAATIG